MINNHDQEYPLSGIYSSGQYVLVHGETQQEELRLLGCFGTNLESARRKEGTRRGPADRRLIDMNLGALSETTTVLTLHEAFFLAYAFGCLSLRSETSNVLKLNTCWNEFRKYHSSSNIQFDFALEYGVYHYFRSRGWIVKSGDNYGTNFLLYREGPSINHAQYAVIVIFEDVITEDNDTYKWESLLTFHRVTHSVGKELLLVFVIMSDISESRFNTPESIEKMKITTKIFNGKSKTLSKSHEVNDGERSQREDLFI